MKALRKMKGMKVGLKRNWLPVLLQAMSRAVAMRHCRAFSGVLWWSWWQRQQQQLRKRQYWRPGRHKGNGSGFTAMGLSGVQEKVFAGQSKICASMKPNYPFQEENSVVHYQVKCQGKPLSGNFRNPKEERNAGNMIQSSLKSDEQKIEDASRGAMASFANQKTEAADPPLTLPSSCDSIHTVAAKQALKKHLKGKQAPQKKISRENTAEEKTDRFPPRAPGRAKLSYSPKKRKKIDELIESGKEEGLKVELIYGKGRGVIAMKQFSQGDFVVEYHGELLEITDAKKREALYAQDPSIGCYMYYFQYRSKPYCVDATRETNRLGRLINHSGYGNCKTKRHDIDSVPHLILVASRDIAAGEEILFDYGDRSKASMEAYPWLKH
ncbi:LOW QUALITY PROTEIN: hypothetical protein ACRRTK_025011 [Alexandromys fortis]